MASALRVENLPQGAIYPERVGAPDGQDTLFLRGAQYESAAMVGMPPGGLPGGTPTLGRKLRAEFLRPAAKPESKPAPAVAEPEPAVAAPAVAAPEPAVAAPAVAESDPPSGHFHTIIREQSTIGNLGFKFRIGDGYQFYPVIIEVSNKLAKNNSPEGRLSAGCTLISINGEPAPPNVTGAREVIKRHLESSEPLVLLWKDSNFIADQADINKKLYSVPRPDDRPDGGANM